MKDEKAQAVECKVPFCRAQEGEPCTDEVGRPIPSHQKRKREAKRLIRQ